MTRGDHHGGLSDRLIPCQTLEHGGCCAKTAVYDIHSLFGNALREGRKQRFPAQAGIASDRYADPVIFRHPHTASGPNGKCPSDQLSHLKSQTGIFTQGYAAQVRSAD